MSKGRINFLSGRVSPMTDESIRLGARHVNDQSRKFAVKIRIHHFLLTQIITNDYQNKQDNHLCNDCIHCFSACKKVVQRYGLSDLSIHLQGKFSKKSDFYLP